MAQTQKGIKKENSTKLNQLIKAIEADEKSYPFREPVDYISLGLLDYPEIVKKPMDLSLIKKKLKKGGYNSVQDCLDDIQLCWSNCKAYNMEASEIYQMADYVEGISKKNIKKLKLLTKEKKKPHKEHDDSEEAEDNIIEDPNSVPFEDKIKFTEKIKKLEPDGLAQLVKMIEELSPSAITDLDSKRLQIKLDDIDKETFSKLNEIKMVDGENYYPQISITQKEGMAYQQSVQMLQYKYDEHIKLLDQKWVQQKSEIEAMIRDPEQFKNHQLPLARVKKIMKSDEDVKMISAEAPALFAKACEMFIIELTHRAWFHTEENKRRTLQRSDIAQSITKTDIFDFLIDIVPREEGSMPEEGKMNQGGMPEYIPNPGLTHQPYMPPQAIPHGIMPQQFPQPPMMGWGHPYPFTGGYGAPPPVQQAPLNNNNMPPEEK